MTVFGSRPFRGTRAATLVALVVIAFVAMLPAAQAQAARAPSRQHSSHPANVASTQISSTAARRARDYWTGRRMASAKRADLQFAPRTQARTMAARVAAPAPAGASPVTINPATGTLPTKSETLHSAITRPYTNRPDRLNGKVFFTSGGNDYVCSGTVVNSNNQDMVDTAGHCVSDGAGNFHTNWVFVPAYSSGASGCTTRASCYPYGKWTPRVLTTTVEWHLRANLSQDLGYAVLKARGGRHIVGYLGGQGTAFNESRVQTWRAFGYPQDTPYNGYDQRMCTSGRLADDDPSTGPGPLTIGIRCSQTSGSSGGGWLIRVSAVSGLGYVNSHTSYKDAEGPSDDPTRTYGPYYGDEALKLYNFANSL